MNKLSDQLDDYDELSRKVSQLSALLSLIIGTGYENFSLYNHSIKQNYLWTCSDLADQIDKLLSKRS